MKQYLTIFIALVFILSSNGLYINEHFCQKSEKSYINILQEEHCCSSKSCSTKEENCCSDFAYFIKSDVEAYISKYNLIIESKFVDFSHTLISFSQIITHQLAQVDANNLFLKLSKLLVYLQPDIHRLQVMLC